MGGTTRRLWLRWQTHHYPAAPTMSGSTLASRVSPSCLLVRSSRILASYVVGRGHRPESRSHWQARRKDPRRVKAVRRVAVQHRKVRDTRLDAHHKLAHRIACDNQAIYVQDLAVSGLARTRLAKSVADAGWSTLAGLLAGEGVALPPGGGAGQSLVPLEPAVLGVWVQLRDETPGGQVLDLHAVWHHP